MNISSINSAADARRAFAGELAASGGQKGAAAAGSKSRETAAVAGQFESMILRQLLSPTIEPLMNSGLGQGSGSGGGVYGYLITDVLADTLGKGGGLGLSKLLQQQLSPKGAAAEKAAATYASGKVNTHE